MCQFSKAKSPLPVLLHAHNVEANFLGKVTFVMMLFLCYDGGNARHTAHDGHALSRSSRRFCGAERGPCGPVDISNFPEGPKFPRDLPWRKQANQLDLGPLDAGRRAQGAFGLIEKILPAFLETLG